MSTRSSRRRGRPNPPDPTVAVPTSSTRSRRASPLAVETVDPTVAVPTSSTRSRRASPLAVETTKADKATTWLWETGGTLVEIGPVTVEMSRRNAEESEEAEDEEWNSSDYTLLPSDRPLPFRCPEYPENGSRKEISEWNKFCDMLHKKSVNDPFVNPPLLTLSTKDDTPTSDFHSSTSKHRQMIFKLGRSIVSISSTANDASPKWDFNGIIIGPSKSDLRVRIVTSSEVICNYKGKLDHKVLIRLPNKVIKDGEFMFFDHYYGLAVLEISIDTPLRCPSFVSSLDYGDEVFVLTRNEDSSLMTTTGKVLWHNEPYFGRNHFFYLSCELPKRISGGLVMDPYGDIVGMTFDCASPQTAVLSSRLIKKLIEMEYNFRCIARPVHDLSLRAVQCLDMSRREKILYEHNIDSGYLVDEVEMNSSAEIIGVRRGDVIVSINGMCSQNMIKLEEYFLSLGWKFLEKKIKSSTIILKLKVYDPLNRQENTLSLPVGFSCLTAGKEDVMVQETFVSLTRGKRKKTTMEPSGRFLRPRKKSES